MARPLLLGGVSSGTCDLDVTRRLADNVSVMGIKTLTDGVRRRMLGMAFKGGRVMARVSLFRNLAFLFVLFGALANSQMSAFEDECSGLSSCSWCSSGSPCYATGGPSACDEWDEGPWPCDWDGTFCQGGKVRCECVLCT